VGPTSNKNGLKTGRVEGLGGGKKLPGEKLVPRWGGRGPGESEIEKKKNTEKVL